MVVRSSNTLPPYVGEHNRQINRSILRPVSPEANQSYLPQLLVMIVRVVDNANNEIPDEFPAWERTATQALLYQHTLALWALELSLQGYYSNIGRVVRPFNR
ncbi:hypothetical protein ElyMa_003668600 [Elysia marginata]|uniref:Uncharacterized protein n=1 Tax=Elysia marginata TaxID=1093978 RepID=A0AAV4EZA5_9GAST|nr:hypothetical protein ElyMa_003668600 [Elysia marginata]